MHICFILERSLGHTSYADVLKIAASKRIDLQYTFIELPFQSTPGRYSNQPGIRSNWSLRASLSAAEQLNKSAHNFDALFFHTQVTSLFSARFMKNTTSLISLDATPVQIDAMGAQYHHSKGAGPVELLKKMLLKRAFNAASGIVTWSDWSRKSVVADYGVLESKVRIIPPGVDTDWWGMRQTEELPPRLNIAFVGGDFERKGGPILLKAFSSALERIDADLHIISNRSPDTADIPKVYFHRNIEPGSTELRGLLQSADLFVLPTLADCTPIAILEAMAAGCAVLSTSVGGVSELVQEGITGSFVPAGDVDALSAAIVRLAGNRQLLKQMGCSAVRDAKVRFDSDRNFDRLLDALAIAATGVSK